MSSRGGGRPKKESTKAIETIVKSEKYKKYFVLEENCFHIPRKHEAKNEDNIFNAIMIEPTIAIYNPSVCSIYEVLVGHKKEIKSFF